MFKCVLYNHNVPTYPSYASTNLPPTYRPRAAHSLPTCRSFTAHIPLIYRTYAAHIPPTCLSFTDDISPIWATDTNSRCTRLLYLLVGIHGIVLTLRCVILPSISLGCLVVGHSRLDGFGGERWGIGVGRVE